MKRTGYITDLLTDYAVDWLGRQAAAPFLLILAHKVRRRANDGPLFVVAPKGAKSSRAP